MFSALKKLTRSGDDRCQAPVPMSSSLQKKFSRGVHFNMKILIKGDRNVGKSCLLQRLQGGPFIEEYVPTDQIQVAPIHWTYKNTDYIVKVEVWEVVDKGRTRKKPPIGLKLDNQAAPAVADDGYETPVLDATFLDVYKNASGVILMLDITKPWTFEYVVKELANVPADIPVVVLGNHCDMQHHRQVHSHHIDQALHHAKHTSWSHTNHQTLLQVSSAKQFTLFLNDFKKGGDSQFDRTAPVRYAESSMRNGFGLRLLHKFLSIPFLRLQKTMLLEQLQRNQKDMEETEKELDDFQNSEESHYSLFVDRLANKRRQNTAPPEPRPNNDRSPSIVLGAGKPIVPNNVNPLLAQSLNPTVVKTPTNPEVTKPKQTQYVSAELMKPKHSVSMDMTPSRLVHQDSEQATPAAAVSSPASALDEFYAGTLDSSFLDDLAPIPSTNQDINYDSDSDDGNVKNPMVAFDQDDLDLDSPTLDRTFKKKTTDMSSRSKDDDEFLRERFMSQATIHQDSIRIDNSGSITMITGDHDLQMKLDDFPLWAGDSSARRSPEGGEDPDVAKERQEKDKKHKKKKSKEKDRGDSSEKSERKEKKQKYKKSKSEKNPQQDLLAPVTTGDFNYEEYDSI